MKKWNSVVILGVDIPIVYKDLGDGMYGEYSYARRTIYMNTNRKAHWSHSVLLHEIIHAILDISAITIILPKKWEEMIVCAIENGLKPLIRFIF